MAINPTIMQNPAYRMPIVQPYAMPQGYNTTPAQIYPMMAPQQTFIYGAANPNPAYSYPNLPQAFNFIPNWYVNNQGANNPSIKAVTNSQPKQQQTQVSANKPQTPPPNVTSAQPIGTTDAQKRVSDYKNDLRKSLLSNEAQILAVIPRIMNAKDTDGNELIQGDEEPGTFINAVDRLDEVKNLGFNTFHVLPIHPPGKINAMGTAGSLYAPAELLSLDPELVDENPPAEARKRIEELYEQATGKKLTNMDKNDPEVVFAQCKYFVDECHKRGIKLMLDLPSCVSLDFKDKYPEMMAIGPDGKDKTPKGWQDIRMLQPFVDENTRELNKNLLDLHKKYVDMAMDLGFDGIRADVGRAKPVEFWDVLIKYSHAKDPQFGWLAETYTHEDASPMLNMPYDRPEDLLRAGFDTYYGQYHIFNDMTKNYQLYDYVKENIDMNNRIGQPKSLIGSFATHDDKSPMLYGGAPWVMFTTILQSMLPQVNPYIPDGIHTGDTYIFPYDHATVDKSQTQTDCTECTVHTGRMDIFNKSRKPGGQHPEISEVVKAAFALRSNKYNEVMKDSKVKLKTNNARDIITKGSFIILPTNNPEIIAFARHKDGKTLLFIGNRNVNSKIGGTIEIPGLKPEQKFNNLMPNYGEECKFQNNQNGSVTVELGTSRACVFEIDDAQIQALSKPENVMQQQFLDQNKAA